MQNDGERTEDYQEAWTVGAAGAIGATQGLNGPKTTSFPLWRRYRPTGGARFVPDF